MPSCAATRFENTRTRGGTWQTQARPALVDLVRGRARAPSIDPRGGRWGLPADFLIDADGRVVVRKYGEHADDHWSVNELLAHAGAVSRALADAPDHALRPESSA